MDLKNQQSIFTYMIDISKDIHIFNSLSDDDKAQIERLVVKVIYESFIITGDEDYLMSRLLAQKGLLRGFYWAAAQAIEKYFKAFLLMNGEGVKNQAHTLVELYKEVCKIDDSVIDLEISTHKNLNSETLQCLQQVTVEQFVRELAKHGVPDNRYNANGVEYNTVHLFTMDSLVYQLRQKIGVPEINSSFRNFSSDLINIFGNNNPWFDGAISKESSQIFSEKFTIIDSSNVTTLDILIKNSNPLYKLALQWLCPKMKLPNKICAQIKAQLN